MFKPISLQGNYSSYAVIFEQEYFDDIKLTHGNLLFLGLVSWNFPVCFETVARYSERVTTINGFYLG